MGEVARVLIGDPDPQRFEALREVLASEFLVEITRAETFDQLEAAIRQFEGELPFCVRLILVAESLPQSLSIRTVALPFYFMKLNGMAGGALIGCLYADRLPEIVDKDLHLLDIRTPASISNHRQMREILSQFRPVLQRHGRIPSISLSDSLALREQIRSLHAALSRAEAGWGTGEGLAFEALPFSSQCPRSGAFPGEWVIGFRGEQVIGLGENLH